MKYQVAVFLLLLSAACSNFKQGPAEPVNPALAYQDSIKRLREAMFAETRESAAVLIRTSLEDRLPDERFKALGLDLYSSVLLPRVYTERAFNLLWFSQPDSMPKVLQICDFLDGLRYHGLIPDHYHYPAIRESIEMLKNDSLLMFDEVFLAGLDMLLTDAWFIIASHLYFGKVDRESLKAEWNIRRNKPDLPLDRYLLRMLDSTSVTEGFRHFYPPHPGYEAMVVEAEKLEKLIDKDFKADITLKTASLKPGDSSSAIPAIREKLKFLGFLKPGAGDQSVVYDEEMVKAVKKLQEISGFNTDGVLGKNTLQALNIPLTDKLDQLYVNMERLRWMPDSLESTYVFVNIADFTLDVFSGNDTLLTMRTIVGRDYRETPVFNSVITYMVLSPAWTVPPTIQRNDVLPAVRKNTGYLASKNMRVYDSKGKAVDPSSVNWNRDGMKYTIRQMPGPQNSLGKVKFMFPNKYNVYLHDTPSRELFARDERTFSSGCIRVEKPFELAELLLRDMPEWTPERIRQSMNASAERTVVLKSPAGVYLFYLTAWGTSTGEVHYRKDIYNRDKETIKALREKHKKYHT